MAKELNENEKNVIEDVSKEINENEKQLLVTRVAFGKSKDGTKIVYDYFVDAEVRVTNPVTKEIITRKTKANLKPADIGGYELIDLIFSVYGDTAPLFVKPFEFDGVKGISYEVALINADSGEIELSVAMKPSASSDKSILANLLN